MNPNVVFEDVTHSITRYQMYIGIYRCLWIWLRQHVCSVTRYLSHHVLLPGPWDFRWLSNKWRILLMTEACAHGKPGINYIAGNWEKLVVKVMRLAKWRCEVTLWHWSGCLQLVFIIYRYVSCINIASCRVLSYPLKMFPNTIDKTVLAIPAAAIPSLPSQSMAANTCITLTINTICSHHFMLTIIQVQWGGGDWWWWRWGGRRVKWSLSEGELRYVGLRLALLVAGMVQIKSLWVHTEG